MNNEVGGGQTVLRLQCVGCGARYHEVEEIDTAPWCRICRSTDYVIEGRILRRTRPHPTPIVARSPETPALTAVPRQRAS